MNSKSKESLSLYLREISKLPLIRLSNEEEGCLIKKIRQGDKLALKQLIEANLRFVITVALEYQGRGLGLDDLIAEGNLGLLKAVERFDKDRGVRFISYAVWWIRQAITEALHQRAGMIRQPESRIDQARKVFKTSSLLTQELGREARLDEVALELGKSEETLMDVFRPKAVWSLDAPLRQDDDRTLLEMLEAKKQPSPDASLLGTNREMIEQVIDTLEPKQAQVIRLYFGINSEPMTLEQIAQKFGLTRERIRQIKSRALQEMRFKIKRIPRFAELLEALHEEE